MSDPTTEISVEWRGQTFTLPASYEDWPIDAALALEDGRWARFLVALLGETDFERAKRLGGKIRDLLDLTDVVLEAFGLREPEADT